MMVGNGSIRQTVVGERAMGVISAGAGVVVLSWGMLGAGEGPEPLNPQAVKGVEGSITSRPVRDGEELEYWIRTMRVDHDYTEEEMATALGLSAAGVREALAAIGTVPPVRGFRIRPYPGGRHPRAGFLDGAIDPQRETKISVFPPWEEGGYAVLDLPEALFCQEGLFYLAHTHIPTVWDQRGVKLPKLEWNRRWDGSLDLWRRFPDGVAYGARAVPRGDHAELELWLFNGSDRELRDLRVQVCLMLKELRGFGGVTNENKRFAAPLAGAASEDGKRWVMLGFERCGRAWGNPPVPCLHSDPVFEDCAPGVTRRVRGAIWFAEGKGFEEAAARWEEFGLNGR
jgi:hypothetical protein